MEFKTIRQNASYNYSTTPNSVLIYISELEKLKAPEMLEFLYVIANTENIYPHLKEKAKQLIKEATELNN